MLLTPAVAYSTAIVATAAIAVSCSERQVHHPQPPRVPDYPAKNLTGTCHPTLQPCPMRSYLEAMWAPCTSLVEHRLATFSPPPCCCA